MRRAATVRGSALVIGLAGHTGMTIGTACAIVGVAVLLAWIPLRNRPGVGTVVYAVGIGPLVQLILRVTPQRVLAVSGWASVASASDLGVKTSAGRRKPRRDRFTTMGECPTPEATAPTPTC